jgi:transcriptional regulator with XRE-family HTH domain
MAKERTTHDAALDALIPEDRRDEYKRRVEMLVARNQLIDVIETCRKKEGASKRVLAERAGLDRASVRRMLTAETANPTAETTFRLFSALGIRLEAVLPGGERVRIVDAPRRRKRRTAAKPPSVKREALAA